MIYYKDAALEREKLKGAFIREAPTFTVIACREWQELLIPVHIGAL